jgi:hypothetical protein
MKQQFFWSIFILLILSFKIQPKENKLTSEQAVNLNISVTKTQELELKEELGFVRNEIFARHGRAFQIAKYRNYFSKFEWYKINPNYNDSLLTKEDLRDIKIIKNYENNYLSLNVDEIKFLRNTVDLIKQLRNGEIDTVFKTIGKINNDAVFDTVFTHIYCKDDSIFIDYEWKNKNKLNWKFTYSNPYMWISESELFQYGRRDIWIIFTIAVQHSVFKFIIHEENQDLKWEVITGSSYFKDIGYKISESDYKNYLKGFKGQVVIYGQDEGGGNLDIWFEPLKKFIPYYRS